MYSLSKLSYHVQSWDLVKDWMPSHAQRAGVRYVKVMNPPEHNPFPPGIDTVGRAYIEDYITNQLAAKGAHGAEECWKLMEPIVRKAPWVPIWQTINEPHPPWDVLFLRSLCAFNTRLSMILAQEGYRACGFNFSVSWPHLSIFKDKSGSPYPDHARVLAPDIDYLARHGHYLGLHEYCAPVSVVTTSEGLYPWTGRFIHLLSRLQELGAMIPDCFIGEAVIDGGVYVPGHNEAPIAGDGYLQFVPPGMSAEDYLAQQAGAYDQLVRTSPWRDKIRSVFLFGVGATDQWIRGFNIGPAASEAIIRYNQTAPPPPAPHPPVAADLVIEDIRPQLKTHPTNHWETRRLRYIDTIIVHHTGMPHLKHTSRQWLKNIATSYVERRDAPGIPYHYAVDYLGNVFLLNHMRTVSWHAGRYNPTSVGIVWIGCYTKGKDGDPTPAMLESTRKLIDHLRAHLHQDVEVVGHKERTATMCPGYNWLPLEEGGTCWKDRVL